jgi:hypothetical protein
MGRQRIDGLLKTQAQQSVFNSLDKSTYHLSLDIRKQVTEMYHSMYRARYRRSSKFQRNYSYLTIDRTLAKSQGWKCTSRAHIIQTQPFLTQMRDAWVYTEEE